MNERTLPRHIAIILDGNGRWATSRGLPRTKGHESGVHKVRLAARACHERKIPVLTVYAFSAANWSRPAEEVDNLMRICREFAEDAHDELVSRGVRVVVVGDIDDEVPTATRKATERLIADTAGGTSMTLALALNYGGRRDMVNAMRAVAAQARAGLLLPEDIDPVSVRRFLSTSELPDADLVIRTGGEQRLSDFLPFEAAFAELFFTETLWPDFSEATLDDALAFYARRQRRFGRTDEQVGRTATTAEIGSI
ncbi:polyprenyl diphosphate synthase [Polyangium spumosum]|uniref:Isoprenyl transferase n=1 Tax=Polyangium spumosum TaxID=889282 RepID=A0A6N7PX80_9BACT|nr:polyprenyl diphosphate synthase [Polyangium spumosum]MRG95456.1 di-trans,poly-cis-decaprenylcistransferase [Polyangium spumosum]